NTGTGLTYQWLLNGSNIAGATSASYTANQAGSFTVNVTNSCGNATSSAAVVTVNSLPTAVVSTTSPVDYCGGQPISSILNANTGTGLTYQWQLNGSNIAGATSATYTATSIGNFTAIVTNTCGNTTSNTISITTNGIAPTATITPAGPTTFCSGNSVILNANTGAGLSYQWLLNGSNISSATSASYTASQTGNYSVLVTNGCGNITSSPVSVTVNAALNTTLTPAGSTTVCFGNTVVINAPTGTNYTYQWQLNGVDIPGATLPSYTATQSGNYSVNITDGVCSGSSITIPVTINPVPTAPVIALSNDTLISTTGFTYQWYYAILNAPINGANSQTYIPTLSGDYYVIVTDANGCSSLQSNTLNVTITGIAGISESGFNIYPNPTNDVVNISFNSPTNANFRIKVINMIGMNIFDEVFSQVNSLNKTIDLSEFASGMYYINIQMKDKSFNTKIIKK
ncbi:MAG: T9SS type A sorting domain-containing protein, partial [Bacteroidetes bacterium]|nr:T9SS type A sorting domain-containing protein [Bacteroidota bacterium]